MNIREFLVVCTMAPVRLYRLFISPLFGPACRFQPSCSAYMLEALQKHGIVRGLFLGAWRLLRCHPWHKACGLDPVPEAFDWRRPIGYKRGSLPENTGQF